MDVPWKEQRGDNWVLDFGFLQYLCVLAGVGRSGAGVLRGEACSRVLHRNLKSGIKVTSSALLSLYLCNVVFSHLALGIIGCSLAWVRVCGRLSLRILWLAVHWRLLTEVVNNHYTLGGFGK